MLLLVREEPIVGSREAGYGYTYSRITWQVCRFLIRANQRDVWRFQCLVQGLQPIATIQVSLRRGWCCRSDRRSEVWLNRRGGFILRRLWGVEEEV